MADNTRRESSGMRLAPDDLFKGKVLTKAHGCPDYRPSRPELQGTLERSDA